MRWRPEYRIVFDPGFCGGLFRAQVWRLWWPKWTWVLFTAAASADDCEERLRHVLAKPAPAEPPQLARYIGPLCLLLALTACTPDPPAVVTPPLRAYTCAEQRQAADELEGRPMLERMITDYATLRAQVRALRNEPEPEGCE